MAKGRKKLTPETENLTPWVEIAQKMRMPVADVRREHDRALDKLRQALAAQGITIEDMRAYFRNKDAEMSKREALLRYLELRLPHLVDPQ